MVRGGLGKRREDAAVLGAMRLLAVPLGAASMALAARLLGLGGFGSYAVLLSVTHGLGVIASFGLGDAITREVAARPGGAVRLALSAVTLTAVPVLVAWLVVGPRILDVLGMSSQFRWTGLVALGGVARLGLVFTVAVARGARLFRVATLAEVGLVPLIACVVFGSWVAIGADAPLVATFSGYVASVCVAALAVASHLGVARKWPSGGQASPNEVAGFVTSSTPLFGNQVALLLSGSMALWVIGAVLEPADAGRYAIAARLASIVTIPGVIVQQMAGPSIAAAWRGNGLTQSLGGLRPAVTAATAAASAYLCVAVASERVVVPAVFGVEPDGVAVLLIILGSGFLVNVATGPSGNALIMADHEAQSFRSTLLGAAVVVLSTWPLVSAWGAVGAALAAAAGVAVINLSNAAKSYRFLGLKCWLGARTATT